MTDIAPTPLLILGDPNAVACEGESCEIPRHHEQAIINRLLDRDAV